MLRGEKDLLRFYGKVSLPDCDGCMSWRSTVRRNGYPTFWLDGETVLAHRAAFEWAHRPLAPGEVVDHLCRNRKCVAPAHLDAVPQRENVHRGLHGVLKTEFPCGHPFTTDNIRRGRTRYGGTSRACLTCHRYREAARRERRRAER